MPLSEYEQRVLSEIEQRLAAEDPRFARGVAAQSPHGKTVKKLKRATLSFVGGFALLITGLVAGVLKGGAWLITLGIAAFVVMLVSVVFIVTSMKHIGEQVRSGRVQRGPGWFNRMEDRWRKRYEQGDDT